WPTPSSRASSTRSSASRPSWWWRRTPAVRSTWAAVRRGAGWTSRSCTWSRFWAARIHPEPRMSERFTRRAVAALFLERQMLDRPRGRRLGPATLTRFVEETGGLQIDSINVLERAHLLTLWSRFGPYDKTALDRMTYRKRLLIEYWAHAACFVPATHLPLWRRAMA